MCQHVQERLFDRSSVDNYSSCGGDSNCGDAEQDIEDVHPDAGAEDDDAETAEERGSVYGVAFVELGLLGAGGGEGGGFSTEKFGEEEGAYDGDGVV